MAEPTKPDEKQQIDKLADEVRKLRREVRRYRRNDEDREYERAQKERYSGFWGFLEAMGDQTCLD